MTNQLKKFSTEDVHETVKHKDRGEIICIQVTFAAEVKPTSGEAKLKLVDGKDYKKNMTSHLF